MLIAWAAENLAATEAVARLLTHLLVRLWPLRRRHKKTPLRETGFSFHNSLIILARLAVVVAFAAKGACCHWGGVALEVSSSVLFH